MHSRQPARGYAQRSAFVGCEAAVRAIAHRAQLHAEILRSGIVGGRDGDESARHQITRMGVNVRTTSGRSLIARLPAWTQLWARKGRTRTAITSFAAMPRRARVEASAIERGRH